MGTGEGLTLKVYLVEDSAALRDRLILTLADLGRVEVVGWAGGAAEAIEGCRKLRPHVVILDVQLSQGSGLDVLKAVVPEQLAALVMVLTNHPYPQYRTKCLRAGADFFFDKATEFDRVGEVLKQ